MNFRKEHIFLQVVESGSLKRAAEALDLDPSVVSRKVAALEARLETKLLNRSTRRSVPTEAGDAYYHEMRILLDRQTELEADIRGLREKPTGRLTVAAPVDFGARFVAPVLSAMQEDFPELAVELRLGSQFANLSEEGADVAIRIGSLADSNLIARRLGLVPRAVVGAAKYFDDRPQPTLPSDLEIHNFVFYLSGQRQETVHFEQGKKVESVTVSGTFTANSITAIRQLVLDGRGLHHGPVWAFENELNTGTAIQVLPNFSLKSYPVQAVMVSRDYVPAKVSLFTQRIRAAFELEPAIDTQ